MSDAQPTPYKVEPGIGVKEQIHTIAASAKQAGKYDDFIAIMEKAAHLLQTDPHGWGEPEYRSKHLDALFCHATIRPVAFRFVIYEQVRGVVLLSVRLFADFD